MSPDQLLPLVREAVAQGLASQFWMLIVIAICSSAIGAFFGAYLKKKGELTAIDEQFRKSMLQLQEQTRAIESIKAEFSADLTQSTEAIRAGLTKELEIFKIGLQDRLKRESEFVTFRYTKTFAAFEEISNLPSINYGYLRRDGERFVQDRDLFRKVAEQVTERYGIVKEIYERVRPLMDQSLFDGVDRSIAEAERQSDLLTQSLYQNSDFPAGVDAVTFLEAKKDAVQIIKSSLARQVAAITASAA